MMTNPVFPIRLTMVSHGFKRARFQDLHLPAMQYPLDHVTYLGIDPPFDAVRIAEIEEGDRLRGFGAWEQDLYGVGEVLKSKREKRGWDEPSFRKEVLEQYEHAEIKGRIEGLVEWSSPSELYPERMPWGLGRAGS